MLSRVYQELWVVILCVIQEVPGILPEMGGGFKFDDDFDEDG
jgi:hypothetical protein